MLNAGTVEDIFDLDLNDLAAPMPRCYQFLDGSAYLPHVERVRKSDSEHESHARRSYELAGEAEEAGYPPASAEVQRPAEEPAVKSVTPSGPAPQPRSRAPEAEAEAPSATPSGRGTPPRSRPRSAADAW